MLKRHTAGADERDDSENAQYVRPTFAIVDAISLPVQERHPAVKEKETVCTAGKANT